MSPRSTNIRKKKAAALIRRERRRRDAELQRNRGRGSTSPNTTTTQQATANGAPHQKNPPIKHWWNGDPWFNTPFWQREVSFNLNFKDSSNSAFSDCSFNDIWAASTDSASSLCWPESPIHLPLPGVA
ncbi:hypothetical protein [Rodent Torque teno virus 6]|uniref:hypothetical protein n=1 Tax=Rodent Torque teno virus 6 TaxID=2054613 RepID=UPI000CA31A0F|nr:hypothetical protein [Rodent Torque teno virus 6]ATX61875.1 hypothetical protein [Rodent Torque teno virus 6]